MLRSNRRSGTPTSLAEASPSPRKDAPRTGPATPRSSTLSRPGLSPTHRDLQVPHRIPRAPLPQYPHPNLPPSRGKGPGDAPHLPSRLCKGLLVGRGRAEARISQPQTLLQRHPRRLRQGLTHRDPGINRALHGAVLPTHSKPGTLMGQSPRSSIGGSTPMHFPFSGSALSDGCTTNGNEPRPDGSPTRHDL